MNVDELRAAFSLRIGPVGEWSMRGRPRGLSARRGAGQARRAFVEVEPGSADTETKASGGVCSVQRLPGRYQDARTWRRLGETQHAREPPLPPVVESMMASSPGLEAQHPQRRWYRRRPECRVAVRQTGAGPARLKSLASEAVDTPVTD